MGLTKQANILTKQQETVVLSFLNTTRNPDRNKLIFLLSVKAGLRAKEISMITWDMVINADGSLSDTIRLQDKASKGKSGGIVWINKELKKALETQLSSVSNTKIHIIQSNKGRPMSPQVIVNMFQDWYKKLGFIGCSSHSGRRTFITNTAKKISTVGGSIRDVQVMARHRHLNTTQRYIEHDIQAQRRVIDLI